MFEFDGMLKMPLISVKLSLQYIYICLKLNIFFALFSVNYFNTNICITGSSTAVSIPNTVLDHNLPSTFTVATWLRHGQHQGQDKHMKEHILCTADDHSKYLHVFKLW